MRLELRDDAGQASPNGGVGAAEQLLPGAGEDQVATGGGAAAEGQGVGVGDATPEAAPAIVAAVATATPAPAPTATPTPVPDPAVEWNLALCPNGGSGVTDADLRFSCGYRLVAGSSEAALVVERHFFYDVLPCESPNGRGGIDWTPGNPNYRTAAQFHPGTMATIEAALGPLRYEDPYDVGRAVAWWYGHISDPGGTGGWPVCFHRGGW